MVLLDQQVSYSYKIYVCFFSPNPRVKQNFCFGLKSNFQIFEFCQKSIFETIYENQFSKSNDIGCSMIVFKF